MFTITYAIKKEKKVHFTKKLVADWKFKNKILMSAPPCVWCYGFKTDYKTDVHRMQISNVIESYILS